MADNSSLISAKKAKNDEFYTQYNDIETEMNAYVEYNPNVFRYKTVLLPCDDPERSNFTKYFVANFERFGLKKLISTSYAKAPTLFNSGKYDEHGKLFTLTRDKDEYGGGGRVDEYRVSGYLEGDGDFRSAEVKKLRDEADIIITNPPFSLFREFLAWIMEAGKQFVILGNMNAITYKEVFPLLKSNEIRLGYRSLNQDMYFYVPNERKEWLLANKKEGSAYKIIDGVVMESPVSACWFTNLDHGKRHQPLQLDTMAHNLKFNKKLRKKFENDYGKIEYPRYDNYDAIEVPFTECIPSDYNGVMGVPITFMDKYNPEQFEIIGLLQSSTDEQAGIPNLRYYDNFKEMRQDMSYTGSSGKKANGHPVVAGKPSKGNFLYCKSTNEYVHSVYARIAIRLKKIGNAW